MASQYTPSRSQGAKPIVVALDTVTNTSGSYTHTTTVTGVKSSMKPVDIEVGDSTVFKDKITETDLDDEITLGCASVEGTSTVSVTLMEQGGIPVQGHDISSAEFDVLDAKIGDLDGLTTTEKGSVVGSINELDSEMTMKNRYIGTVTASTRQECMQAFSNLLNTVYPFSGLASGTVITGAFTWSGNGYCSFTATKTAGDMILQVQIYGKVVTAKANSSTAVVDSFTDLNSEISDYSTGTITRHSDSGTAGTFQSLNCYKVGKIVCIHVRLFGVSISPPSFNLAVLPVGFRPKANLTSICYAVINGNTVPCIATITADGLVKFPYSTSTSWTVTDVTVTATYPTP